MVLRTFSKAYGLAGFRVGYCVADAHVAAAVRAVSLPFGVSIAAQAAVIASLEASRCCSIESPIWSRRATRWPSACGISALGAGRSRQLRHGCPAVHVPRRTQRPLAVLGVAVRRTPREVIGMVCVSLSVSRLRTPACWRVACAGPAG